ncbi:MAG: L-histidine N(alpha)-methyltransferase [Xanthobacteraceae bacterium]|nr:L-histidine N(alpha)-methyltransferase [Xanthobacteraceae bacterium]
MSLHVSGLATARARGLAAMAINTTFAADVIAGLTHQPKYLAPKYFYDAAGSQLFEEITRLPEYYPTRTELGILHDHARKIAGFVPDGAALVEFGAGATTKVRLLLERGDLAGRLGAYVPVDISGDFLRQQAQELARDLPQLRVLPVAADFTASFALPQEIAGMPRVGFFPGSTLGNFEPRDAGAFLRGARAILGDGARLIIGIDLEKAVSLLEPAYDDAAGVTARFNLNLLTRINRELGGDFELSAFTHRALYRADRHRIEMHLVSRTAQTVHLLGRSIAFRSGESIHTENSYKYSLARFAALARDAGWTSLQSWTDAERLFAVHVLGVS